MKIGDMIYCEWCVSSPGGVPCVAIYIDDDNNETGRTKIFKIIASRKKSLLNFMCRFANDGIEEGTAYLL